MVCSALTAILLACPLVVLADEAFAGFCRVQIHFFGPSIEGVSLPSSDASTG
jgi:hypothetical protein